MKTVYDFTVKDMKENKVSLTEYKGKVLLIVNTATGFGKGLKNAALKKSAKQHLKNWRCSHE